MHFGLGTFCSSASEWARDQFLPFASAAAATKQPHSASVLHKGLSVGQQRQQQPLAGCLAVGRLYAARVSALTQGAVLITVLMSGL